MSGPYREPAARPAADECVGENDMPGCCCAVLSARLAEVERERDFHRGRAERLEAHLADLTARLERMAAEQDLRPALQASMEGRGR